MERHPNNAQTNALEAADQNVPDVTGMRLSARGRLAQYSKKFGRVMRPLALSGHDRARQAFLSNQERDLPNPTNSAPPFNEAAAQTMDYDKTRLESGALYCDILKDKPAVNTPTPGDSAGLIEGVKGVWQYDADDGAFTRADMDEAPAISGHFQGRRAVSRRQLGDPGPARLHPRTDPVAPQRL